jgi:hypothetical protein
MRLLKLFAANFRRTFRASSLHRAILNSEASLRQAIGALATHVIATGRSRTAESLDHPAASMSLHWLHHASRTVGGPVRYFRLALQRDSTLGSD